MYLLYQELTIFSKFLCVGKFIPPLRDSETKYVNKFRQLKH